jgi:hypothetical protein
LELKLFLGVFPLLRILLILILFCYGAQAQQQVAFANAIFRQSITGSQHLYTGSEFIPYRSVKGEHPYFLRDELITGRIKYDGWWYDQIPMRLDIERNSLIIEYYYNTFLLELDVQKIDEFEIEGKRFVNIKAGLVSGLIPGFYEILYQGKSLLYQRWSKALHEQIIDNEIKRSYKTSQEFFVVINNTASKISGIRGMSALMEDHKKEIKAFLKAERNRSLESLLEYYDSLSH